MYYTSPITLEKGANRTFHVTKRFMCCQVGVSAMSEGKNVTLYLVVVFCFLFSPSLITRRRGARLATV